MIIDISGHPAAQRFVPEKRVHIVSLRGELIGPGEAYYHCPHLLIEGASAQPMSNSEFNSQFRQIEGTPGQYYDLRAKGDPAQVCYTAPFSALGPVTVVCEPFVRFSRGRGSDCRNAAIANFGKLQFCFQKGYCDGIERRVQQVQAKEGCLGVICNPFEALIQVACSLHARVEDAKLVEGKLHLSLAPPLGVLSEFYLVQLPSGEQYTQPHKKLPGYVWV